MDLSTLHVGFLQWLKSSFDLNRTSESCPRSGSYGLGTGVALVPKHQIMVVQPFGLLRRNTSMWVPKFGLIENAGSYWQFISKNIAL